MNPNDFKRGIESRHARAGGDSSGMGRLGRMHETASRDGRVRRRGSRSGGKPDKDHKWLSLVLGGVAMAVLLGAVVIWLISVAQRGSTAATSEMVATDEPISQVKVASQFPSPSKDEAIMLVEKALENRDPKQVEKLFRMGSASVSEVIQFCEELPKRDGAFDGCQWLSSIDSRQMLLEGVVANFKTDDHAVHQRLVLLTPDSSGRWQVDFEALARVVKPSWEKILAPGTGNALVRVTLAPDFYYNGPFRDEAQWVSYGMSSPDLDFLMRAYCRKGSAEAEALKRMFSDGQKTTRALLEIRHVDGGEDKQFEVARVLAQDWVLPAQQSPLPVPTKRL